jgi:cytochrome c553
MRRVALVSGLLMASAACAPATQVAPVETQAELLSQGEYLVTRVAFCSDCHTPWLESGPDPERLMQGAPTGLSAPLATFAPAIVGIPEHYTEEQFAHFLMTGERPDGTSPLAPMPRYRLSERDARAVTAYINALPPAVD